MIGARGETRTHDNGFAIRRLSHLATRADLFLSVERKERFELSSRVWKTRMFPATSLPLVSERGSSTLYSSFTPYLGPRPYQGHSPISFFYPVRRGKAPPHIPAAEPQRHEFGTPEKLMVGEDRIELSPRVPKTRMLALHHTPLLFHTSCWTNRTCVFEQ